MTQVSPDILREAQVFLVSLLTGVGLVFCYDLLRILRRLLPHGTFWIAWEDLAFWLASAVVIFLMLYREIDGNLRGFTLLGVAVGMLVYVWLLSRYVVKGMVFLLEKLLYVLFRPLVCLGRMSKKLFGGFWGHISRPIHKFGRFLKKELKKLWKTVKIGLYKR